MNETWKLTIWGVRGSFPAPDPDFFRYGGNTSCLSLDRGDTLVVLDAGSGLAALGDRMVREGRRRVDILLSHLHLDHVMGLFPFAPRYDRRCEIHLYGRPGFAGELTHLIGSSLWPVDLADDRAHILFHEVWDGKPFLLAEGAAPGELEVGIMIETPAAVMISDELAEMVDFFSIGTNDLTQYTLAIDRQNEKLDDFYNPHHKAILRMIKMVVDNSHKCGKWTGICGELGADTELTEEFINMGVDELSVSPSMVLKVRQRVREIS